MLSLVTRSAAAASSVSVKSILGSEGCKSTLSLSRNCSSMVRNVCSACAKPPVPGRGRGPRRMARSRVATTSRVSFMPSRSSGCFSKASSVTGARPLSAASAASRAKFPARTSSSVWSRESSAAMSHRASAASTRRPSARSGVTSVTVLPSCTVSRSATAIASASSSGLAASITVIVQSAAATCFSNTGSAARCRHMSVAAAGRNASDNSCSRPPESARLSTAARVTPMRASSACIANCGCPGAGAIFLFSSPAISCHDASSRSVSRPGSTTVP